MSVLLITYTLNNKQKDYSALFDAIKNNSSGWWHYVNDTWIVDSPYVSAHDYAYSLFPFIEKTDRLLVVKIGREHQGWLPPDAWEWLNGKTY